MANTRQDDIRNYLFDSGETPVQVLADAMGASLATVRRDLTEMEKSGLVERLHGAARIARLARSEAAFAHRETTRLAEKRAIASLAFEEIKPGSMIFLDAGTTVLQLARRIMLADMPVTLVTNSLVVARELTQASRISLILLGGRLRAENLSTTGPGAVAMLETMWFDQLFLGASAISNDGWLSSYDENEAQLNAHMAKRAAELHVLADHSKFGQRAAFNVLSLKKADALITDKAPDEAFYENASVSSADIKVAHHG